jgi:alkylhydroperoxidase/carboxymuconolactone decarboxylase family protein YurZ
MYRCVFVLSAIVAHNGQAMAEINGANKEEIKRKLSVVVAISGWSWYFTNGNK